MNRDDLDHPRFPRNRPHRDEISPSLHRNRKPGRSFGRRFTEQYGRQPASVAQHGPRQDARSELESSKGP